MAKTAVVNPRRMPPRGPGGRFRKRKRRNPVTTGAAANPRRRRGRRRNPEQYGGGRRSPYSTGGYYRRPNARRRRNPANPSLLDIDTWTRVLPAGVAGVWIARWAVAMAGPFEPDATGIPVPGFKHAIAAAFAVEVGGRLVGEMLGAQREVDIAQIGGISYVGDLFLRKRILRDSPWVQQNISLEGAGQLPAAAGNGAARAPALPAPRPTVQLPADAQPGDVVCADTGDCYQVMSDGTLTARPDLGRFYNPSMARQLAMPTPDLPGGSTPSDMQGFMQQTPLGDFYNQSQLGAGHRVPSRDSSFGYSVRSA